MSVSKKSYFLILRGLFERRWFCAQTNYKVFLNFEYELFLQKQTTCDNIKEVLALSVPTEFFFFKQKKLTQAFVYIHSLFKHSKFFICSNVMTTAEGINPNAVRF